MSRHSTTCVLQCVSLQSPVGELLLHGCEKGVHTITITMENAQSAVNYADVELNVELQRCVSWLQSYFISAKSVTSLTPPAIHHPLLQTETFSVRVLRTLQDRVSVGETVSYKQLAEMAGNSGAVRAVGGAMRRNPVGSSSHSMSSCVVQFWSNRWIYGKKRNRSQTLVA
ncbi:methylated-DNA--protein-cysteine methyltransferase isoform X3 [Hoplias malabaricus]|uniref:methylated-DNA--protein-cysteine methyltransferase isoform X3 n=1 Tax=Hoplias malabaricus TaxID=27720 RepID=UPI003462350F